MTRKEKKRYQFLAILILCLGYVIYKASSRKIVKPSVSAKKTQHQALVATQNLFPNYIISAENITWETVTASTPKGVIILNDKTAKNIIGKKVTSQVNRGNFILKKDLKTVPSGSAIASNINKNMVATDVSINKTLTATKILPGDRVNLILTKDNLGHPESSLLLTNILVLASSNSLDPKLAKKSKTIEVTLELPVSIALHLPEIGSHGVFSIMITSSRNREETIDNALNMPHTIVHISGNHTIKKNHIDAIG